jgi:hypothetical protein
MGHLGFVAVRRVDALGANSWSLVTSCAFVCARNACASLSSVDPKMLTVRFAACAQNHSHLQKLAPFLQKFFSDP